MIDNEEESFEIYKTKHLFKHQTDISILRIEIGYLKNHIERLEKSFEKFEDRGWINK